MIHDTDSRPTDESTSQNLTPETGDWGDSRLTDTQPAQAGAMEPPWQRVRLASGIELHFQLRGDPTHAALVQDIVAAAGRLVSAAP